MLCTACPLNSSATVRLDVGVAVVLHRYRHSQHAMPSLSTKDWAWKQTKVDQKAVGSVIFGVALVNADVAVRQKKHSHVDDTDAAAASIGHALLRYTQA